MTAIEQPIIILGAPRSGTTILFRCLCLHDDLWHLPGESHRILEGPFHPARIDYRDNAVAAEDVSEQTAGEIARQFAQGCINLNRCCENPAGMLTGNSLPQRVRNKIAVSVRGALSRKHRPACVRLLEKTPKNTLRAAALNSIFPRARFLLLTRQTSENVDSLIAGWRAVDRLGPWRRQRFCAAGYPIAKELSLRDYDSRWWKFALPPDWRRLCGMTLADVAAWQFHQCNRWARRDLARLPSQRVYELEFESFVEDPVAHVRSIFAWAELPRSEIAERFARRLPRVNDATPDFQRGPKRLRYENQVHQALERLAALHRSAA